MPKDRLLTPPQVATHLQINERTVTQWLRKGHLRGFKIGKEWRVSSIDLETFLDSSANVPPSPDRPDYDDPDYDGPDYDDGDQG